MSDTDTKQADGSEGNDAPDEFDTALVEALQARSEGSSAAVDEPSRSDPADTKPVDEPKPGSEQEARQVDPAGGQEPPAAAPSKEDIWKDAPPELKAAFNKVQEENRRRVGQISALDRQLAQLRRDPKPAGQEQAPSNDAAIQKFREEYGEIADPVMSLIDRLQSEVDSLKAPVQAISAQREMDGVTQEFTVFAEAHPDWQTYVEDTRYPAWLQTQPKAVQDAAARAVNVEDGQEAAWLLTQFKQSLGVSPSPAPQQKTEQPAATDPKRQRQLDAGRDAGSAGTTSVTSAVPDDFDAVLQAEIAKRERQTGQRGNSGRFV